MYEKVGAKIFSSKIHSIYISFPFFRKLNNFCWLFHENEIDFKTKRYWWDTQITKVKEALAFFAKNLFSKSETCTLFSTLSSYIILSHTFTWSFHSFFSYILLFQPFFQIFSELFFRLNLKFINSWNFFLYIFYFHIQFLFTITHPSLSFYHIGKTVIYFTKFENLLVNVISNCSYYDL